MSKRKTERLLGLVVCLLSTTRYLTAEQVREAVPGYPEQDELFKRMFERDKEDLRDLGVPLETGVNHPFDDDPGYRIRQQAYQLPELRLEADEAAVLGLAARVWRRAELAGAAAYWVPIQYQREFLQLSLHAISLRGTPQVADPDWHVAIKNAYGLTPVPETMNGTFTVKLVLDQPIANDYGYIDTATFKGLPLNNPNAFIIIPSAIPQLGQPVPMTREIKIQFTPANLGVPGFSASDVVSELLKNPTIGIRVPNLLPAAPPTDNLLDGIRSQLELQRLGQFGNEESLRGLGRRTGRQLSTSKGDVKWQPQRLQCK